MTQAELENTNLQLGRSWPAQILLHRYRSTCR